MTSRDWARPIVYFSIEAVDAERQRAFYAELFNWDIAEGPFMRIPAGVGSPENGIGGHINAGTNPHVTVYVQVRRMEESLEKAVALGGAVVSPPFQIPGGAMVATITDPEGNTVGIVQQ